MHNLSVIQSPAGIYAGERLTDFKLSWNYLEEGS